MFRFAQHDILPNSERVILSEEEISDHFFHLPWAVIDLWLLFRIVTQIEPAWVRLLNKWNFPAASPALQLLLACDRVIHVAKVFNPDEPAQLIAFGQTVDFFLPVLVQARDIIRDPDVQRGAMFIGEDVYPVVVIAHASRNGQRCLKAWPHASHFVAALRST